MPKVKAEEREWLETNGAWKQFCERRSHLRNVLGYSNVEAHRTALAEFYRPDGDPVDGENGGTETVVVPSAG